MLRNLIFVGQFAYLSIRPKTFLFFQATFEQRSLQKATFVFSATFGQITGKFLENLEQLVESPRWEPLYSKAPRLEHL